MLYMAIGHLIHEERKREIERALEMRRLLEPADDTGWNLRDRPRKSGSQPRLKSRHEATGAAS